MRAQPDYAKALPAFFAARRDLLAASLAGSGFRVVPTRGSYFFVVDYSEVSEANDLELALQLTKEAGVASIPLSPFFAEPPQDGRLLRLCFAKEASTLQEAGRRLSSWSSR
jgi:methionine aminotransferase